MKFMQTNIDIEDKLIEEALFESQIYASEQELIKFAWQELIRQRKKPNLLDLSGKIQLVDNYDYKA